MDLNQLLYRRLSQDNLLNGTLSKYADKPAIFNTEFPPDQQEGWNGKSQYPRISYVFNKQVDTKRSSSGQLTVALYDIMDPLEVEKMEVAIRNCLQDVVMKPEGEAPMCFAWARSEPYILEGNAVLCKEIAFDILEYPAQETTDPDPVMALNRYIKKLFPECIHFRSTFRKGGLYLKKVTHTVLRYANKSVDILGQGKEKCGCRYMDITAPVQRSSILIVAYRKLSGTVTSMRWHLRIFLRIRRQGRILIVRDIPF